MTIMRTISATAAACALLALAVGCSPSAAPNTPKITQEQGVQRTAEGVVHPSEIKDTPAEQNPNRAQVGQLSQPRVTERAPHVPVHPKSPGNSYSEVAQHIADTVTRIPGVERASVLVTGKSAIVGVDLASNITGSRIDTLKYSVKEAAERTGNGYNAIVTSDIDTVTRARSLIAGVRAGKPVSTVSDEIADILSRLVPEM